LHAAELARRLGIRSVLVSPFASALSALGMLAADVIKDYSQTVMLAGDTSSAEIDALFGPLAERGVEEVSREGIPLERIWIERNVDIRYKGQSYELSVPYSSTYIASFHAAHERIYGYRQDTDRLELVNIRVKAVGSLDPPPLPKRAGRAKSGPPDPVQTRKVWVEGGFRHLPAFSGEVLNSGDELTGPCLVVWNGATLIVPQDCLCMVDSLGNVLMDIGYTQ
jgi:N-methylhydantoinase A